MSARGKAFVRRWFAEMLGKENLTAADDLRPPYRVGHTLQGTTGDMKAGGKREGPGITGRDSYGEELPSIPPIGRGVSITRTRSARVTSSKIQKAWLN